MIHTDSMTYMLASETYWIRENKTWTFSLAKVANIEMLLTKKQRFLKNITQRMDIA